MAQAPRATPKTKGAKVWGKLQKARTKVIAFIEEEDVQKEAGVLRSLIDDYKQHGRVSSDREIRVHYDAENQRFMCPVCRNKFVKQGNLMSHIELIHLKSASDRASKIHQRRFGFENRSVQLAKRLDDLYLNHFKRSGEPSAKLPSHRHTDFASENVSEKAELDTTTPLGRRMRRAYPLREQSPLAIPVHARNPGRDMDDEYEKEDMRRKLKELRPRRRRRGSPVNPEVSPIEGNSSNASNSAVSSPRSPIPPSALQDLFPNEAWARRPGPFVPHGCPRSPSKSSFPRTASSASMSNSETSSARPVTAPEHRWKYDELAEEGLDHIAPVPEEHQTPHWKHYLPAYCKRAGNPAARRQLLDANNGCFTKTSYVSARQKTPDLFADTVAGHDEHPAHEESTAVEKWLPYEPPKTASQTAAQIASAVRPLSREESLANALTMELRNFRSIEWIGADRLAETPDGNEQGPAGDALPGTLSEYFSSRVLPRTPESHLFYREHVVDKRRVPGKNSSRAKTAPSKVHN